MFIGVIASQIALLQPLLTNGNFANAGDGWTRTFFTVGSGSPAADNGTYVTFDSGACQIKTKGSGRAGKACGNISRNTDISPTVSTNYTVAFDFVGSDGVIPNEITVTYGSASVTYQPTTISGSGTVTITTSSTSSNFSLYAITQVNSLVTIDNIVLTKA